LKQRTDHRWAATLKLDNGKRKYFYAKTKREAQEKLEEARLRQRQGHDLGLPRQTVADYLDDWLKTKRSTIRASTYDNYSANVERLREHIGAMKLDALRASHIDDCYRVLSEQGLKAHSVAQTHRVLRTAMRHAVKSDRLLKSPTLAASPPRAQRREMKTLSPEQVQQLFESTQTHRLHALWVLLATTGLRVGEAGALIWEDIDPEAGRLSVRNTLTRRKGHGLEVGPAKTDRSRRTVRLTSSTVAALRHHRDRQNFERQNAAELWTDLGLVFCTEIGAVLDTSTVHRNLQKCLSAAGLPKVRTHDLRHTAATLQLSMGTHPKVVQEMLGHSSIAVTMDIYSHVMPGMQEQAAERMEALLFTPAEAQI